MTEWRSTDHVQEASTGWTVPHEPIPPDLTHETSTGGRYARHNIKPGERFGELTTIEIVGKLPSGSNVWICKCSCGGDAIRPAGRLNASVRNGYKPSCAACLRELRGGLFAARIEALREAYRRQYIDYGTLWTFPQTTALMNGVRSDLEAEFGSVLEETVDLPISTANGWANLHLDFLDRFPSPIPKEGDEDPIRDEAAGRLALAVESGSSDELEAAIDAALAVKPKVASKTVTFDRIYYSGWRIGNCVGCGQRIRWKPVSEKACVCNSVCFRRYEARIKQDEDRRELENTRTKNERAAAEERLADEQATQRRLLDRERMREANEKREHEARQLAVLMPADVIERTVESLKRQFAEQHNIQAYYVEARYMHGYLVLSFTMTNHQNRPLYVIEYNKRHGWILGASSADEAITTWLARGKRGNAT